jgi:two-component sensor histidine kinase
MNVTAFRTVRGRLLALMVLVVLPIAVTTAVTAATTYRSVLSSIEAAQMQTVGNFAVRAHIWYRETLRSLLMAVASVAATDRTTADCDAIARRIVGDGLGFNVVSIRIGARPACNASGDASFDMTKLDAIMETFRQRPRTGLWAGPELAEARYGYILLDGRRYLGVHARRDSPLAGDRMEAFLLVDAYVLDRGFELGELAPGTIVALVQKPDNIVISRGAEAADRSWLPRREIIAPTVTRWMSTTQAGDAATFASQVVAEPDFYILARFGQTAERAAFLQFITLLLTPLVTLAVLFAAYSLAIDSNIIRWVRGIEAAAVARASNQPVLAPVDPTMPDDIRQVSEAFNALVSEQAERVEKLNLTVGANRYLVRELHHRVKNSLQVVQSYLSLARRHHGEAHRAVLADVEAKVHVLSIAYRHALAQGEMRPVELKPFLEEVTSTLNGLLTPGRHWVSAHVPADVALVLDRAIPLGLLVVEIASHILQEKGDSPLDIGLALDKDGIILLDVKTDARSFATETKVAHGLLRQLEAIPYQAATGSSLGQWQIPP